MLYNDPLNFDSTEPFNRKESLTERLVQMISADIRCGKYAPGEKFLPKRNLSVNTTSVAVWYVKLLPR